MTIKILLADDHAVFQAGLRRILEEHPEFFTAEKPLQDWRRWTLAWRHQPDVAIVDLA